MSVLSSLSPQPIWSIFEDLTAIPRPSGHEEQALQYLEKRLDAVGVEHWRDQIGNLMMRKPATPGCEQAPGIVLQSHIDMVPQKGDGVDHDFTKDSLKLEINDGWVKAVGTTLGADNGLGVAAIMALMESTDIEHGQLEGLVTIDEERGLVGAQQLEPGRLTGDILLNLDSEDEGELFIGCAGGADLDAVFPFEQSSVPAQVRILELRVTGLSGGHSGVDIHLGRANAIQLLSRFMATQMKKLKIGLASFDGGTLRNAIPRDARMLVCVPGRFAEEFQKAFEAFKEDAEQKYRKTDPGMVLSLSASERKPQQMMQHDFALRLLSALNVCPSHALRMSPDAEGVTETSNNLAVIETTHHDVKVRCMSRSLIETAQNDLVETLIDLFEQAGGKIEKGTSFGGWTPNTESPLLKTAIQTYEGLFNKTPEIKVMHAGLECGLLGRAYPNWDMISFGPTIKGAHSPSERLEIETVDLFWTYLLKMIGELKTL